MSRTQKTVFLPLLSFLLLFLAGMLLLAVMVRNTGEHEMDLSVGANGLGKPPAGVGQASQTYPTGAAAGSVTGQSGIGSADRDWDLAPATGPLSPPLLPVTEAPEAPQTPPPPIGWGEKTWVDRPDGGMEAGSGDGPISGRVTDPWGNGIAGVRIFIDEHRMLCVKYYCSEEEPDAMTDAQGYYSVSTYIVHDADYNPIRVPLTGQHKVFFIGNVDGMPGREEWYDNSPKEDGALLVPAGSGGVDAVLVPAGSLAGQIIGNPGRFAEITVYRADRPEPVASYMTYSPYGTAPGASFAFNLEPGEYKLVGVPVSFSEDGAPLPLPTWYDRAGSWEQARRVRVTSGQVSSIEFRFRPATRPSGQSVFGSLSVGGLPPRAGTLVSIVDAADPGRVLASKVLSQDDFSFDFGGLPPAAGYKLSCTLPGNGHTLWFGASSYNDDPDQATIVYPGSRQIEFDVNPQGARVSGRVHRPDGSPVRDVHVEATLQSQNQYGLLNYAYSQQNGNYCFGDYSECDGSTLVGSELRPGTYEICAQVWDSSAQQVAAEYCLPEPLTVDWYDIYKGMDIEVPQDFGWPIEISGRVTMADGSPAAGAEVELEPVYGGAALKVTADDDGRYKADGAAGLVSGTYHVCATDSQQDRQCYSYYGYGAVSVYWQQVISGIDIVITPGASASGTVYAPEGDTGTVNAPPADTGDNAGSAAGSQYGVRNGSAYGSGEPALPPSDSVSAPPADDSSNSPPANTNAAAPLEAAPPPVISLTDEQATPAS